METTHVDSLINQALACRKLAWSLTDERTQLLLHEIASEYEVRAIRAANGPGQGRGGLTPPVVPARSLPRSRDFTT